MLIRFAYLAVTNTFTALRLIPISSREKDAEILALRHQVGILQRQLGGQRVRFEPADRALPAALPATLPRGTLRRLQLVVSPDTVGLLAEIDQLGTNMLTAKNGRTLFGQTAELPLTTDRKVRSSNPFVRTRQNANPTLLTWGFTLLRLFARLVRLEDFSRPHA